MKKKSVKMAIDWMMLVFLAVVFVSGILLKVMPGMLMGITHALSGVLLVITVVIHIAQHAMLKRK